MTNQIGRLEDLAGYMAKLHDQACGIRNALGHLPHNSIASAVNPPKAPRPTSAVGRLQIVADDGLDFLNRMEHVLDDIARLI